MPHPIPSGLQTADVFYCTRKKSWEAEAVERAKAAVRRQYHRGQEGVQDPKKFLLTEHMDLVDT